MTQPLVFTDLDDSLFQTARKMAEPPREDRLAATATNGHHSYMTDAQDALVTWLLQASEVIPVTARSTEALSRCAIPFTSWQVAANGAVILAPDGTFDPAWQSVTAAISAHWSERLAAMEARLSEANRGNRLRFWTVMEAGMPIYFCVKSNGEETWLSEAEDILAPLAANEMTHHRNGNNLSYIPPDLSKAAAVAELTKRIGAGRVSIGIGDSLTDLPFMSGCTMMMMPPGSQIVAKLP